MFEFFVNSDLVRNGVERQFTAANTADPSPRFRRIRAVLTAAGARREAQRRSAADAAAGGRSPATR